MKIESIIISHIIRVTSFARIYLLLWLLRSFGRDNSEFFEGLGSLSLSRESKLGTLRERSSHIPLKLSLSPGHPSPWAFQPI